MRFPGFAWAFALLAFASYRFLYRLRRPGPFQRSPYGAGTPLSGERMGLAKFRNAYLIQLP